MPNQLELGQVPAQYNRSWLQEMVSKVETWARTRFSTKAYVVTNATTSRTFDAGAASLDETRQVLATLLDDLKNGRFPG